jgi:hypothetical protein
MGGPAASFGFGFQHAWAVLRTIQSCDDPLVDSFRFEGGHDAVDLELIGVSGVVEACQAKTRSGGPAWTVKEVAGVLVSLSRAHPDARTRYTFATNGPLSREANKLRKMTAGGDESLRQGTSLPRGLTVEVLERSTVTSGMPSPSSLIGLCRDELHALRPHASRSKLESSVDALLREVMVRSGEEFTGSRTLTRQEAQDILGVASVDPKTRDPAPIGHEIYLPHAGRVGSPLFDELDRAVERARVAPGGTRTIAIWGPPGTGKSVAMAQLVERVRRTSRVVWLQLGPESTSGGLIELTANQDPAAGGQRFGDLRHADLVAVDDCWSPNVLRAIRAVVPEPVVILCTTGTQEVTTVCAATTEAPYWDIGPVARHLAPDLDPQEPELEELARLTGGWPLLVDLVRRSIDSYLRQGLEVKTAVHDHVQRLTQQGPLTFDPHNEGDRNNAIRVALSVALDRLPRLVEQDVVSLGFLQSGVNVDIASLELMLNLPKHRLRSMLIEGESLGILKQDSLGNSITIHDAVRRALSGMTNEEPESGHLRLTENCGQPRTTSGTYATRYYPVHLALAGRARTAIQLMNDDTWESLTSEVLGDRRHLAGQAVDVARAVTAELTDCGPLPGLAWIVAKLHGSAVAVAPSQFPLLAMLHGIEVAEAVLDSSDSPSTTAEGHAVLAAHLHRSGNDARARSHARAAVTLAAQRAERWIPDQLITVLRKVGRTHPEVVRGSVETLQAVVESQEPDQMQETRAIVAGEMLDIDPDVARAIIDPDIEGLRSFARGECEIADVLRCNDVELYLRNALGVIAYVDLDLASILQDWGIENLGEEGVLAFGGVAQGASMSDGSLRFEDLAPSEGEASRVLATALRTAISTGDEGTVTRILAMPLTPAQRAELCLIQCHEMVKSGANSNFASLEGFRRAAHAIDAVKVLDRTVRLSVELAELLVKFHPQWASDIAASVLSQPGSFKRIGSGWELAARATAVLDMAGTQKVTLTFDEFVDASTLMEAQIARSGVARLGDSVLGSMASETLLDVQAPRRFSGERYWRNLLGHLAHDAPVEDVVRWIESRPRLGVGSRYIDLLAQVATRLAASERNDLATMLIDSVEEGQRAVLEIEFLCRHQPFAAGEASGIRWGDDIDERKLRGYLEVLQAAQHSALDGLRGLSSLHATLIEESVQRTGATSELNVRPRVPRGVALAFTGLTGQQLTQYIDTPATYETANILFDVLGPCRMIPLAERVDAIWPRGARNHAGLDPFVFLHLSVPATGREEVAEVALALVDEDIFADFGDSAMELTLDLVTDGRVAVDIRIELLDRCARQVRRTSDDGGTLWHARIAAAQRLLTGLDEDLVSEVLPPWIRPSADALIAAGSGASVIARAEAIKQSVESSMWLGPDDVMGPAELFGEALGRAGAPVVREFGRAGGFEHWPGGAAGFLRTMSVLLPDQMTDLERCDMVDDLARVDEWLTRRSTGAGARRQHDDTAQLPVP